MHIYISIYIIAKHNIFLSYKNSSIHSPFSNVLPYPLQIYPKLSFTYIGGGKRVLSTWSLLKAFNNTAAWKEESPASLTVSLYALISPLLVHQLVSRYTSTSFSLVRCNRNEFSNPFFQTPRLSLSHL